MSQKTLSIQKDLDLLSVLVGKKSKSSYTIINQRSISTSRTTNWRYFNFTYQKTLKEYQNIFNDNDTILWVDNYSKFYKLSIPK